MRYPVASTPEEFKNKWYSAQGYGAKTSYGYHEGEDLNLKTGGNSDLGQPLYAIADGVVTSVQKISTGFGHNIHIKHEGAWGTVWSHCAHLQNIKVKSGDKVSEGQQVAEVGHTGNSRFNGVPNAHLHFALKNKPTGLGDVANDLKELKDWEDPIPFIEKWMNNSDPIDQVDGFEMLVKKATQWDIVVKYLALGDPEHALAQDAKNTIAGYKSEVTTIQNEVEKLKKEVAEQTQRADGWKTATGTKEQQLLEKEKALVVAQRDLTDAAVQHERDMGVVKEEIIRTQEVHRKELDAANKKTGKLEKDLKICQTSKGYCHPIGRYFGLCN